MKQTLLIWLTILLHVNVQAQSENRFKIISVESRDPEYGRVRRTSVLFIGNKKISFQAPDNWTVKADAGRSRLTFLSPDFLKALTMTINLDRPAPAPTPVPGMPAVVAATPAPARGIKIEDFRNRILEQHPDAQITQERARALSGFTGWDAVYKLPLRDGYRIVGRTSGLRFEGGEFYASLVGNGEHAADSDYASFLNSIEIENAKIEVAAN